MTEQDVINEEMYEEEDDYDDIPMQYRRLTAHLQTGSQDFNDKLSAYLTSNVAVRNSLEQVIQNSHAHEHRRPQSVYGSASMSMPMYQQQYMGSYHNRPSTFPLTLNMPANGFHGRSASAVEPTRTPIAASSSPPQPGPLAASRSHTKSASPSLKSIRPNQPMSKLAETASQQPPKSESPVPTLADTPGVTPSSRTSSVSLNNQQLPLSSALPIETQQLLAQGGDWNDAFYRPMMTHPQYFAQPQQFNSTSMSLSKQHNFRPNTSGMSATLAPSALDMKHTYSPHNHGNQDSHPASATVSYRPPVEIQPYCDNQQGPFSAPPFQPTFGVNFPDLNTEALSRQDSSAHGSQRATPGTDGLDPDLWNQFMNADFVSESRTLAP